MQDILEVDGQPPLHSPGAADVEKALASLDMKGPGYCILTLANGSYVQTAGTKVGLLVEYREVDGENYRHYVIGHQTGDLNPTNVRYKYGLLQLLRNEVLIVDEARKIFITYLAAGRIPEGWNLRDISDTFE